MKKYTSLALYAIGEIILYASYWNRQASFHWFNHFLVGASVAMISFCIWIVVTHKRVGQPLLWLYLAHIFAMIPDILYNVGHIPHELWMDVFFGHISSHFIPGRNWTLYAIFIITLGIYLVLSKKILPSKSALNQTISA